MKPLAIDLFCGLSGWGDGLIAEGFRVVGFDIKDMFKALGRPKPEYFSLVIQDVMTLHGSQFRDAALIVASPPCQEYSYMAMPWTRAKAKATAIRADTSGKMLADLNRLFDACFRIQKDASFAAGRHIPMVIENVRGAQPWAGRARWNFGSYYLWGDVPALMPFTSRGQKFNPDGTAHPPGSWFAVADSQNRGVKVPAIKNNGGSWFAVAHNTTSGKGQNPDGRLCGSAAPIERTEPVGCADSDGRKGPGGGAEGWFQQNDHPMRQHHSAHPRRKAASAMIAKIPLPLARHIAAVFRP